MYLFWVVKEFEFYMKCIYIIYIYDVCDVRYQAFYHHITQNIIQVTIIGDSVKQEVSIINDTLFTRDLINTYMTSCIFCILLESVQRDCSFLSLLPAAATCSHPLSRRGEIHLKRAHCLLSKLNLWATSGKILDFPTQSNKLRPTAHLRY